MPAARASARGALSSSLCAFSSRAAIRSTVSSSSPSVQSACTSFSQRVAEGEVVRGAAGYVARDGSRDVGALGGGVFAGELSHGLPGHGCPSAARIAASSSAS